MVFPILKNSDNNNEKNGKYGNVYGILSMFFTILIPFFPVYISYTYYILAVSFLIIGRIKYPNNKFLKVMQVILIIITVLSIISFFVVINGLSTR